LLKGATEYRAPACVVLLNQQESGMTDNLHKRIEQRAYELWEEAGRPEGQRDAHWRTAEVELEQEAHTTGGIPVTDVQEGPASEDPPPTPKRRKKR
jgi:hypothetical protein